MTTVLSEGAGRKPVKPTQAQLQRNGAKSLAGAWNELMNRIEAQTSAVA